MQGESYATGLYSELTSSFIERLRDLLSELDPLGLWQSKHGRLVIQSLAGINALYHRLNQYLPPAHQELVTDALFASFQAHELTLRKSDDELFFEHPLATARYLAAYQLDAPTLAAALLHDVAEDTKISISTIVNRFGPDVGKLVDGVTKLQATGKEVSTQLQQEEVGIGSINKLFQFMIDDVRVVLVKLADRRHNMLTLDALPPEKQREKAYEVLDVYAPLAYRLGMWDVKSELERMALEVIEPARYAELDQLLCQRDESHAGRLQLVRQMLEDHLRQEGIEAEVESSPEQIYSIYRSQLQEGRSVPRLADTLRVAVLVGSRSDCYRVLCSAHQLWRLLPGTFDDYIAQPRENLYQSLHTTVFGPGGLLKLRIRTHEMHRIAHDGVLARWSAAIPQQSGGLEKQLARLLQRLKVLEKISEGRDRLDAYREALSGQIQVFTPEGEMVELPAGSTPIDFAYQIHSKLGDETRGARVNGVPCPLNTRLRNADQVTIIRVQGAMPLREWLDEDLGFVQSTYARNRIRRAFRRLDGGEATAAGWDALNREMRMMGLVEYDLEAIAAGLGYADSETLLHALARATLAPHVVAHHAMAAEWESLEVDTVTDIELEGGAVLVRGVPNLMTRLCRSCQPQPGDPILGNMLRGGQVTVHRMDCPHISNAQQGGRQSLLEVEWGQQPRIVRPAHIWVGAFDRPGLAYDMTEILNKEGVNIRQFLGAGAEEHNIGLMAATIEVTSLRQLSRILHRVAQIPNLIAVERSSVYPSDRESLLEWALQRSQEA